MVHNFAIDCAYRDLQRRVDVRARAVSLRRPHWHVRWGVVGQALRHHYHRHYWNNPPIGGALLASDGDFAVYQHNQPLPVVVMSESLAVVWVCLPV